MGFGADHPPLDEPEQLELPPELIEPIVGVSQSSGDTPQSC